ncbi:CPBP family intramembrane glutamic endopeptidase [Microbacterium sp.]|uniref:CPBP family intramembrane glutamic endopeptidase n=1 Tax=Microbacterium sp. TaxID=51671 RepID=UPI002735D4F1|nr:CPBP family intramembrane glutamic endopeptidase [Microbacterium sp.]MDP3950289.1 CPBP family intramembrane metalloprotease [Microbacterium sp.]
MHPPAPSTRSLRSLGPEDTWAWLPWVLGVLLVATIVVASAVGLPQTLGAIGIGVADAVLTMLVVAPLLFLALRGRAGAIRVLVVLFVLIGCSRWALGLPRVGVFAELDWNWQGKTLELVWLAVLFAVLWRWAREEAGLGSGIRTGSGRPVAVAIVVVFIVAAALSVWAFADADAQRVLPSVERVLFDSTHANLTEELLVRGAMLAILDRVCGTPWRFFGAQVGWGLVLTTVWFGLWHGLVLSDGGLDFDLSAIISTGVAGLLLGWVRARSGSIWLAYVAHCAPELGVSAGQLAWALAG